MQTFSKFWNRNNKKKVEGKGVIDENAKLLETVEVNGKKVEIPKEHKGASLDQQDDCPFMQMQKPENLQLMDTENKPKKEKKPKGGCPFMPSEKKKNPPLNLDIEDRYDISYVSAKNYLLNCRGFFASKKKGDDRKQFDSYPIYLKHTLLHQDNPQMIKARLCEVTQKFFCFDQFREKGNKNFKKGDYELALNCYEHALSTIRWIELKSEEQLEQEKEEKEKLQKQQEEKNKCGDNMEEEQKNNENFNENQKKSSEELFKNNLQKGLQKQAKLINKKTKKGSSIQSKKKESESLKRLKQLKDEYALTDSDEDMENIDKKLGIEEEEEEEDLDYEEPQTNETEEQRLQRQKEQEEKQRQLFEKAKQGLLSSTLQNNDDNLSDNGSLQRGQRSNSDNFNSDNEDNDINSQKQDQEEEEDIYDENWKDEDSMRSDIAIGDLEDMQQNLKEVEQEQKIQQKREEKIQNFMKEEERQEEGETHIKMEKQESKESLRKKAEAFVDNEEKDKEFEKKYRLYLASFNDQNTVLKDGEELTDSHEIDMRQGMLLTILLNISCVYQKMGHFSNALEALQDAEKVAQSKSSQIYYRKSQIITHNLSSTLKQLRQAKDDIEFAIRIKHTEKIFQQEKGILHILNLQDHEEAYREQAIYVTDRIHRKVENSTEKIDEFLRRAAEIEEIYQEMIQDGRKVEGQDDEIDAIEQEKLSKLEGQELKVAQQIQKLENYMEKQIVQIMVEKYYNMIDFYAEQYKKENVQAAQQELQDVLKVQANMNFYYDLDVSEKTEDEIVLELNQKYKVEFGLKRVIKRLEKLKRDYARNEYEDAVFNFQMLEYSIKEYYKKLYKLKGIQEELCKKRLKIANDEGDNEKFPSYNPFSMQKIFSMGGLFQITFFLFIVIVMYSFSQSQTYQNINFGSILGVNPFTIKK